MHPRPTWREVIPGMLDLGYRRTKLSPAAGTWLGRRYLGNRKYQQVKLGLADDMIAADGTIVLDYTQALKACQGWFEGATAPVEATVASAMQAYFAELRQRGQSPLYAQRKF